MRDGGDPLGPGARAVDVDPGTAVMGLQLARHPNVAVVLDNARCKRPRELRSWRDRPECRVRRVDPPAYAPNLNPIGRFWHVTTCKVLFNRAYAKLALFEQAFDALASLITHRFHSIGTVKTGMPSA